MSMHLLWALSGLAAYMLGAVPFGLLVAASRGIDIRQVGSRNIGATNVFRSVGRKWGILTFLLDMGKGYAGAALIPWAVAAAAGTPGAATDNLRLVCGVLAVAGHNWPVYLGFKGGKGVATSAGMLLGLAPEACGIALVAWVVVLLLSRYVSLASMSAAAVLAVVAWPLYLGGSRSALLPIVLTLLAALVVLRHRANIARLAAGTESRFRLGRRNGAAGPAK